MIPLPTDEFALEMRNHFLETTLLALQELRKQESILPRFIDLSSDWEAEAKSNELPFFAAQLEVLRDRAKSEPQALDAVLLCENTINYLNHLKTAGDDPEWSDRFFKSASASGSRGEAEPSESFTVAKSSLVVTEETKTFLQCRRGDMRFLLPVDNVVEISQYRKINPLPKTEPRIKGLIGFRGQGTPVFNLEFAGFPAGDEKSFFVICEHASSFFALEVNATDDILKIKASEFQPSQVGTATQFTTKENKILLLLDIAKLVA